jgi:hypothetical protein
LGCSAIFRIKNVKFLTKIYTEATFDVLSSFFI